MFYSGPKGRAQECVRKFCNVVHETGGRLGSNITGTVSSYKSDDRGH